MLALPFEQRASRRHTQLFRRTDPSSHCCVLLDGYAARYKLLRDGSRQILNILMRGDLIGMTAPATRLRSGRTIVRELS